MPAAYDNYNYPAYWEGREYEHEAEIIAIEAFLKKIPKIDEIVELGAGYGRLTPAYAYRANKVTLVDPSAKLLKLARQELKENKKINFIQAKTENTPGKIKKASADLVIVVRVLHHIDDIDLCLEIIKDLVGKDGHLILEYANKTHFKATVSEFVKGNLTFTLDIFSEDKTKKKKGTLPFKNYHPEIIRRSLEKANFQVKEVRSVSNIRSPFLKSLLPLDLMLFLERHLQRLLAKFYFGPSIFLLAKKKG